MRSHQLTIVALVALCFAAGPSGADEGAMNLAGLEWGIGDQKPEDRVVVQFGQDNRVSGRLGCNQFMASYEQSGSRLRVKRIASTMMACQDEYMELERNVAAALKATRSADISHKLLVLKDEGGREVLRLMRRDWD
jgi:heat shock protein HslJ